MLDHWTDVEGRVGYVTEKGGKQHRNHNKSPSRKKNMLDIRLGNVPPPPGSNRMRCLLCSPFVCSSG